MPLHSWLPMPPRRASSVSGPLSGIITKMGMFGIVVLLLGQTNGAVRQAEVFGLSWFGSILTFMGAATLIFGELMALKQDDIKRMLAYSSVEHMGILALAVGLGGAAAFGGMLHAMCHSLTKCMLFLLAGNILARYHTYSSYDVHGLRWTMPVTGALWMGGFLAIVGSPPFGLFVSEFLILKGILQQGQWLVAALYMLALAIISWACPWPCCACSRAPAPPTCPSAHVSPP